MLIVRATYKKRGRAPIAEDFPVESVKEVYIATRSTGWPGKPYKRVTLKNGKQLEIPAGGELVERDAYGSTHMCLMEV